MLNKLLFTFLFTLSLKVWSQNVKVFVVLSPAGDFIAESNSVIGQATEDEKGLIEASNIKIDVKTLKTGIGLRDEHMVNKYLEAAKYPEILLKLAKGSAGKGVAILVIKSKEAKVSGTYEKVGTDKIKAKFDVKLSDFNIKDISYKGIGVDDVAKVEVTLPLTKKAVVAADKSKIEAKPKK